MVGGAALFGLFSYLLRYVFARILKREPMGLGDVKFFTVVGLWLGPNLTTLSLFLILSGLFGVVFSLIWRKKTGQEVFPFGPALVASFVVLLIWHAPFLVFVNNI